ncbi:MAG: hypothetical protein IKC22_06790 [Bacilli bacterium]|nr:hypothetical protein [Bacilli bacterium]
MFKKFKFITVIIITIALTLMGCEGGSTSPTIKVTASQPSISIEASEVETHDFKQYFTITEGSQNVTVLDTYLDLSALTESAGSYIVTCTYKTKMASIIVEVNTSTTVKITTLVDSVTVNNLEVLNHNYKQYFSITDEDLEIEVQDSYLDLSSLRLAEGTYTIRCTYNGVVKTLAVNVTEVSYQIKLESKEISVKQSDALTYDYKSLFTAVVSGKIIEITDDMIKSNISNNVGTYQYTVYLGETSMTLTVNVISDHDVEIINSYNLIEIEESKLNEFDFTKLFSVYVDGVSRTVTIDMIDKTGLNNPVDGVCEIKITYTENQAVATASCNIKIVKDSQVIVTTKNIVTYPNGEHIDLTTLFEIKKGNEIIPVTNDLITGTINYSEVGNNVITLTYKGVTYKANVEVKQGVIINYTKDSIVKVGLGTSKSSYAFNEDFSVLINGVEFSDIKKYINVDNVDFTKIGSYEAVISIPYKDSSLGINETTLFTKTITYEVVDVTYNIYISNQVVELPTGSTSYNVFDNLSVKVNGINQKLVKNAQQVSAIATYAYQVNEIDFNSIGLQEISVAIFVFGPDKDPVYANFKVIIKSDIDIKINNAYMFEGSTLYTKDLFTITVNGNEIPVTQDMIEGKVDTFTPGVYSVVINYQGILKEAKVIVLNKKMIGQYKTNLITIGTSDSTDEEGYEDAGTKPREIKDLFITEDGRISVDGTLATILYGIDENTMYIKVGSYEFTLYYNDGIVVLDPDNKIKLGFINDKRPLVYFHTDVWELSDKVTINSANEHILVNPIVAYTIDAFKIKSLISGDTKWYGLNINLYEKANSDTNYLVTHGFIEFSDDFEQTANTHSSLRMNNEVIEFNMLDSNTAKVGKATDDSGYKFAGHTFVGKYNGLDAILSVDIYEGYLLKVGDQVILNVSGASVRNQKYGGADYENNTVLIIDEGSLTEAPYSFKFSLDLVNNTFTYIEKDIYYGRYENSEMMLFFDGYGSGLVNFDIKQYGLTTFDYQRKGNELEIVYTNTKPTFTHGEYATFYMDSLNNALTAKYFKDEEIRGSIFVNNYLTDGAIINISTYTFKTYSNAVLGRKALFDSIQIILPDGEVTDNNIKITMIDISDINFAVSGFYHFSITCSVNGNDVVMHYALQII